MIECSKCEWGILLPFNQTTDHTMATFEYPLDPRLSSFTVRNLPISRRLQLSGYLNSEQILLADNGLARDYRGIAQQLQFNSLEMGKLARMLDPFEGMLTYQRVSKLPVDELLRLILNIGRYDVLDDTVDGLLDDLKIEQGKSANDQLLLYDSANCPDKIWYDAYVCYADSDLDFVQTLVTHLETLGLRLYIRERDQIGGEWVYESFSRLIKHQCRHVLVILSPEFLQCSDCAFQSQLATGLAIETRSRLLIPIIYKHCEIPSIIKFLTKIDMTRYGLGGASSEWAMNRLIRSIQPPPQPQPLLLDTHLQPRITYPPSTSNSSSNIIELIDSLPTPETSLSNISCPTLEWDKADLNTTMSTISNLTIADHDDQKQLLSSPEKGEKENTQGLPTTESGTQRSRGREWLSSIKRKMKVKM